MNGREIILKYLQENGYDGLAGEDCGCGIDDLCPCDAAIPTECVPARLRTCDGRPKIDDDGEPDHECPGTPHELYVMADQEPKAREILITQVIDERRRQDEKWGAQHHGPDGWLAILTEEVGEVAKAILEGRGFGYRDELIQVAAVAVAAVECFDGGNLELGSLVKLQNENQALRAAITAFGVDWNAQRDARIEAEKKAGQG